MIAVGGTVGITTTIPVEAVLAAGMRPLDLNNLFASHPESAGLVERALAAGFPQSSCAWLKGIYGALLSKDAPDLIVGVVRGDCSGTGVLLEAISMLGLEVVPFSYPYPPSLPEMRREIEKLCSALGTTLEAAEEWREKLVPVRRLLSEMDSLCWEENLVTGSENHLWLVASSDFNGDPERFRCDLEAFMSEARMRKPLDRREGIPFAREVRLGYIGVPPVVPEI